MTIICLEIRYTPKLDHPLSPCAEPASGRMPGHCQVVLQRRPWGLVWECFGFSVHMGGVFFLPLLPHEFWSAGLRPLLNTLLTTDRHVKLQVFSAPCRLKLAPFWFDWRMGLGTKYSLQIVPARQLEDENSELDISGRCFCRGLISLAGAFTQSTSRHEGQIWFRVDWFDSLQTQPLHKDAKFLLLSGDVVCLCLVIPKFQTLSYLFLHGAVHLAAWCGKSVGVSQRLGGRSAG